MRGGTDAVRICLGSRYPISLWWGRSDLKQFYNDAFIPIVGQSASGCWAEIWDVMHPMLERVFAASRTETMVRDLLTYTQASLVDTPAGPIDAAASLRTALDNLAGAIQETGATVESGTLPFLPAHETHLQHLFQNLVGNAIKYRRPDVAPQRPMLSLKAQQTIKKRTIAL